MFSTGLGGTALAWTGRETFPDLPHTVLETDAIRLCSTMTEDELRAAPEADYMSPAQLNFFRDRLMAMREELRTRQIELRENLETADVPTDPADRATREEQEWLEMRLRERESTLLTKIDESLRRIHSKEYGYCTKSGDAIGISRLLARPTATTAIYT